MHATDVIGWAYDGAMYCLRCKPDDANKDDIAPIYSTEESDSIDVCDECGDEIPTVLTALGHRHEWEQHLPPAIRVMVLHAGTERARLPAYIWPGGYSIMYLSQGGSALCARCADRDDVGYDDPIVAQAVNWEDPQLLCDDCGSKMESAY